ncbi:MAG TPA: hypothetical protein VFI40_04050 [Nocardioides sp.]|nr:hypothetical protein [Nocardioides sp.]
MTEAERWYAASATEGMLSTRGGVAGRPGLAGEAGPRTCRRVGSGSVTGGELWGAVAAGERSLGSPGEVADTS